MYKDFKEQVKQMANTMLKSDREYISLDYNHTLVEKLTGKKRKAKLHTFPCGAVLVYFNATNTDRMFNSHSALEIEYEIDNWDRTFSGTTNWSDVNLFFQPSFDVLGFISRNGEMLKSKNLEEMDTKFKGEEKKEEEDYLTVEDILRNLYTSKSREEKKEGNLLILNLTKSNFGTKSILKVKLNISPEDIKQIEEFYDDSNKVELSLHQEKP
jgi:hypothetical protein